MKAPIVLSLPVPDLFSFDECLWFLDRGFDDCMHRVQDGYLYKALDTGQGRLLLQLGCCEGQLLVTLPAGEASAFNLQYLSGYIREWLHLDAGLQPFYRKLESVKSLAYMTTAFRGLRLPAINSLFEALCWSIIGQQINLTFAYKLKRRLVEHYGTSITAGNVTCFIFPEPAALAAAEEAVLRDMQFSRQKINYLVALAAAFEAGVMGRSRLDALPSFADRQQALLQLKGVGVWTANYVLMKSLREPGSIPHGDAGLLQALVAHGIMKDRKDLAAAERLYRKFKGWESYLVFYLWRSLAPRT